MAKANRSGPTPVSISTANLINAHRSTLKAVIEECDEWFDHADAERDVEKWDRSLFHRFRVNDILEGRSRYESDNGTKSWRIRTAVVRYLDESNTDWDAPDGRIP